MSGPRIHEGQEKTSRRWQGVLARVGISGAILGGVLAYLPGQALWEGLRRISGFEWGIGLFGFLAMHLLGAFKWRLVLQVTNVRLSWRDAIRCYCAGLFANLFLPSLVGGDILRAGLAMRNVGRKEAVVVGSLLDRLIDVLALCLLVVGGWLMRPDMDLKGRDVLFVASAALGLMIAATLLLFRIRPPSRWSGRVRRRIARAGVALRSILRGTRRTMAGLGLGVGIQGSFVLVNAFLGAAIGLLVPLQVWFLTWPLAKLAALIPISLGGLGVREVALAGLLYPFGVPAAVAVAQSLLWETILFTGSLSAGLIWWGMAWAARSDQTPQESGIARLIPASLGGQAPPPGSRKVASGRPIK